jgi:hypothetical protein
MSDKLSLRRGPKELVTKTRSVSYTMSTATQLATLPKGARILYLVLSGTAASTATTATLSIGTTATSNELVNTVNVLAAGSGNGTSILTGVTGAIGGVLTTDTPIYAKYAESGGTSTTGTWKLHIVYTTGNIVNDDTI